MPRALTHIICVFRIHLARLRAETGSFLLAAVGFPVGMYLFVNAVATVPGAGTSADQRLRFLAGSIVFSLSLTAISWLGYLLLENRFTGRLKLFATLPLAPSSYVLGILVFAIAQAAIGTASLFVVATVFGVHAALAGPVGVFLLAVTVCLMMLCGCGIAVIIATRAQLQRRLAFHRRARRRAGVDGAHLLRAGRAAPRPADLLAHPAHHLRGA